MATLFDLAQQYLNRSIPETFRYTPRTTPPVEDTPGEDNVSTPARILPMPSGGGDGYSVYNPDPNSIGNKNYSPYAYRQALSRSDVGIPSQIQTSEFLYGPQLTGIPGAISNYAKNSFLGKGLDALGNMMPVNRRAIYENELASDGIMVNDIGQIVSDGGNINTAQNIMAGYNAAKVDADTFAKRRAVIEKNMKNPEQKAAKLKALAEAEAIMLGTAKKRTDMVFEDKMITKDPSLKGPSYLEDAFDFTTETPSFLTDDAISSDTIVGGTNLNDFDGIMSAYTPSPGDLGYIRPPYAGILANKNINKIVDDVEIPGLPPKIPEQNIPATPGFDVSGGGGGSYDQSFDYSGGGDKTASDSKRTEDRRSSDLGFSGIRLKENVELIGKSPSNINIYKFNYKNNPTTYQGAMAHEVPWASVKHSNGYMMIDYNQIDVEFKKWLK